MHEGECLGMGTAQEIFELYQRTIKVDKLNIREE
jgi:hypothetical protein